MSGEQTNVDESALEALDDPYCDCNQCNPHRTVPVKGEIVSERVREKAISREADAEALASGAKSREQLRAENSAFGFPRERVRIDFSQIRDRAAPVKRHVADCSRTNSNPRADEPCVCEHWPDVARDVPEGEITSEIVDTGTESWIGLSNAGGAQIALDVKSIDEVLAQLNAKIASASALPDFRARCYGMRIEYLRAPYEYTDEI